MIPLHQRRGCRPRIDLAYTLDVDRYYYIPYQGLGAALYYMLCYLPEGG